MKRTLLVAIALLILSQTVVKPLYAAGNSPNGTLPFHIYVKSVELYERAIDPDDPSDIYSGFTIVLGATNPETIEACPFGTGAVTIHFFVVPEVFTDEILGEAEDSPCRLGTDAVDGGLDAVENLTIFMEEWLQYGRYPIGGYTFNGIWGPYFWSQLFYAAEALRDQIRMERPTLPYVEYQWVMMPIVMGA